MHNYYCIHCYNNQQKTSNSVHSKTFVPSQIINGKACLVPGFRNIFINVSPFLYCDLVQIFKVSAFPRLYIFVEHFPQVFDCRFPSCFSLDSNSGFGLLTAECLLCCKCFSLIWPHVLDRYNVGTSCLGQD